MSLAASLSRRALDAHQTRDKHAHHAPSIGLMINRTRDAWLLPDCTACFSCALRATRTSPRRSETSITLGMWRAKHRGGIEAKRRKRAGGISMATT